MVKMQIVRYLSYNNEKRDGFTDGVHYPSRQTKSGMIAVKNDLDQWIIIDNRKMSISNDISKSEFKIVHEFSVQSHKEAIAYSLS